MRLLGIATLSVTCSARLLWAQEAPPSQVALTWLRLAGAEACPGPAVVARRVNVLLKRTAFVDPASATRFFQAAVRANVEGPGWQVNIVVSNEANATLGTRDLSVPQGSCSDAVDAAALALALMIDPNFNAAAPSLPEARVTHAANAATGERPSRSTVSETATSRLALLPRPGPSTQPAPSTQPGPSHWRTRLGLAFFSGIGTLPHTSLGAVISFELRAQSLCKESMMNKMGCPKRRIASAVCALSMLLGCGAKLNIGADEREGEGGTSGENDEMPLDTGGAGGSGPGCGGASSGYGCNNGGSGGFHFAGMMSFIPGVDCSCDARGDSVCSGSLASLCGAIPGCKPSLADVKRGDICGNNPFYAYYAAGEQTVITYGIGANNRYQMVFDTASGEFVGGSVSGYVGLACSLGGRTEFAEGVQIEDPEATCRLCSASASEATGGSGASGTIPSCAPEMIP